jgi:uncharacterized protein (TIGR03382 family)
MHLARIVVVVVVALVGTAHAHFILNAPAADMQQSSAGDPQKIQPCGGAGTATNMVTTVEQGSQLTIMIDEVIPHAGHYRIALAPDMGSLPADPPTDTACSFTTVESPPVLPVIADNMLPSNGESGPHTFQVPIPASPGCTTCKLQVIEFMLNHGPPGCYYHHCATLNVVPPGSGPDAGTGGGGPDAGTGGGGGGGLKHGCSAAGGSGGLGGVLVVLALAIARRRRGA